MSTDTRSQGADGGEDEGWIDRGGGRVRLRDRKGAALTASTTLRTPWPSGKGR